MVEHDVNRLVAQLADHSPDVRKDAAFALRDMGTDEACAALITALRSPLVSVRMIAAEVMDQCASEEAVSALCALVQNDPAAGARQCAARTLGHIGRVEALAVLLDALEDSDPKVCRAAARSLGRIGDARVVPNLQRLMKRSEAVIRQVSATALGQIGDRDALPDLVSALSDPTWMVRVAAAEALGNLGEKAAFLALTDALEDSNHMVRVAAQEALKKLAG